VDQPPGEIDLRGGVFCKRLLLWSEGLTAKSDATVGCKTSAHDSKEAESTEAIGSTGYIAGRLVRAASRRVLRFLPEYS
jgi:hypothetical protein